MATLKELQRLGKEMQEGIGFDPPVNYKETDIDKLTRDIIANSIDLDAELDNEAISDLGKKTLLELGVSPWKGTKDDKCEEEEKPKVKPKKEKATKKTVIKKKADKLDKPKAKKETKNNNKTQKAIELFKTGKYSMGQIKTKLGTTYYSLLAKLEKEGHKVIRKDGKILLK